MSADFPFWTEAETRQLQQALGRQGHGMRAMGVAMLDGYLCARTAGPVAAQPLELLRWVFDTEAGERPPVWPDADEAGAVVALIMRQARAIPETLARTPLRWRPALPGGDDDRAPWQAGYALGVARDAAAWEPLRQAQPQWFDALGIDPAPAAAKAWGEPAWAALQDAVRAAAAHWHAQRRTAGAGGLAAARPPTQGPTRHTGPRVGRNDPCPCGSGRKYKHCHGA